MATKKITDLQTNASPELTDYTLIDDGSDTQKVNMTALRKLFGTQRVQSIVSNASITPNVDLYDVVSITALAVNTTVNAPTGTPIDFQTLTIRIKDDGFSKSIAWDSVFAGVDLPTKTVASTTLTVSFVYDATLSKWSLSWSSPVPSNMLTVSDRVTITDGKFLLMKSFENTITPVDTVISKTTDGIENVSTGAIPYYQNSGTGRRAYISNLARSGNRSVKMILSPDPPYGVGEAFQVWYSGFGLGVGSGSTYNAVEGSEYWFKSWIYLSPNWSWEPIAYNQSYSTLKLFRFYPFNTYQGELIIQQSCGHGYAGYEGSISAFTQGFTGGNISLYSGPGGDCAGNVTSHCFYPVGQWFCIEAYMKISATPATAKVIVWRDGVKILEKTGGTTYQTLNRTGTNELIGSPGVILYSTWDVNGNQDGPTLPNGEQYICYDSIIATNNKDWVIANGMTDSAGNVMIGNRF